MQMYDSRSDPPNGKGKDGSSGGRIPSTDGVFMALAKTESWIAKTLDKSNSAAKSQGKGEAKSDPYVRKEVSYVCETSDESATIVAGVFRRLREAREMGEMHGRVQEARIMESGPEYAPGTLRQTNVVVIPSSDEMASWHDFDKLLQVINQARRNARDYVTESPLDKKDEGGRDWVVSVNCAHLHPNFGEKTPKEIMEEMKKEEEEGEVDLNLKEYKERRLQARRSPYPTLVLEVRATPPPDFGKNPPPPATELEQKEKEEGQVTSEDIQKLEALFGKTAALDHPAAQNVEDEDDDDDDFYAKIGMSMGIDEVSVVSPLRQAQLWIAENDQRFDPSTSTFTETDVRHVDSAYEFVFSNIAMHCSETRPAGDDMPESSAGSRSYLVMPSFVPSSATSFEKFSGEVVKMVESIPSLAGKVRVSTMHPEHVKVERRSPVPIFLLKWSEDVDDDGM